MENTIIETEYPLAFRRDDASSLGKHIKNRHSVVLIGMKRVGINNFLRFFLYHKTIIQTYVDDGKKHLFIPIDLFDLVEREVFPFWNLTFKRIVDSVNKSELKDPIKKDIESFFIRSIQFKDLFFTIDSIRESLVTIVESGFIPTLFFNRFDRMKSAATPTLFDNLRGLDAATHHKLSYVFTSFRNLDQLSPLAFPTGSLSSFAHQIYLTPAAKEDVRVIYETYKKRYGLVLSLELEKELFKLVDGYIQYLQLAMISLHEREKEIFSPIELFEHLVSDERIFLQSEELWESLEKDEQLVLKKILHEKNITQSDRKAAKYLWESGFVVEKGRGAEPLLFSPLFTHYFKQKEKAEKGDHTTIEFSKKENALFIFLKLHVDIICEREKIIESVWPEAEALGVSDWAIDRLVARLRYKLKLQKSNFEIQTIKTRGYKLIPSQ